MSRIRYISYIQPRPPVALYHQGMMEAERIYGDGVRDYDRVLCGICYVLKARGITLTPVQLSNYFHCPLASYSRTHSFEAVVKGMHEALTTPARASAPSWDQEQVLKGQLSSYRRYQPLDDLIDDEDLTWYLRTLREALTTHPTCPGTLPLAPSADQGPEIPGNRRPNDGDS